MILTSFKDQRRNSLIVWNFSLVLWNWFCDKYICTSLHFLSAFTLSSLFSASASFPRYSAFLAWSAAAVLNVAHSSKIEYARDKFGSSTSFFVFFVCEHLSKGNVSIDSQVRKKTIGTFLNIKKKLLEMFLFWPQRLLFSCLFFQKLFWY